MPTIYDYDDETGDVQVLTDGPEESTFLQDGLMVFQLSSNGE